MLRSQSQSFLVESETKFFYGGSVTSRKGGTIKVSQCWESGSCWSGELYSSDPEPAKIREQIKIKILLFLCFNVTDSFVHCSIKSDKNWFILFFDRL